MKPCKRCDRPTTGKSGDEDPYCPECERKIQKVEIEKLTKWVHDLQSDMYINCVYCGHRYGPSDKVPATMADALKEHIEQCPKHPMSVLKKENKRLTQKVKTLTACHLNMKDTDDLIADKVSLETKIGELRATIKSQDGDIRSLQENGVLTYQEESRLLGEDMQQLKQIILEWEERCSNLEGKISTKDKRRPSPQAIQKEQKEQLNQEEEN